MVRAASILFAAALLLLAVSPSGAAPVTRAAVDGHRSLRAGDVLDILSAGEGSVFDLSAVDAGDTAHRQRHQALATARDAILTEAVAP